MTYPKFPIFIAFLLWTQFLLAQNHPQLADKPSKGKMSITVRTKSVPNNDTTQTTPNRTTPAVETVEVCKENKIILIKQALHWAGYYQDGDYSTILNETAQQALIRYQQDHFLPVGNLNMDTIRELDRYLRKNYNCSMLK